MSGHASAASEDLAAQNCPDSDNKRIPSESEREPDTEIPSKSERKPFPEIPSTSKRKPGLKKNLTESERDSDAESDDGQQRLPGPSLYGKKPGRWISKEEWHNYMKEDPDDRLRLQDVTIFKIPNLLKDTKRKAYVPQVVSLGPYHHRSARLTAMDHYKGKALRNMMTKYNEVMMLPEDATTFAETAMKAILGKENKIRQCYEKSIDCDGNTLSMMLCLDGCFILQVLKTLEKREFRKGRINASIFGENMAAASNILKDILMLENQIPWIVLVDLLELDCSPGTLSNVMAKVTCGLFKISKKDRDGVSQLEWLESAVKKVPHFLGFLHMVIVHRSSNQANPAHRISIERCLGGCLEKFQNKNKALNLDFKSIPTAVELKNAGIKFRPYNGGIKQIKFDPDSSTIYLPLLSITGDTEVLFRNLIAFEMCSQSAPYYVSSYVNLMKDLIDSQKEVAFLRSKGILANQLESDQEVADLFNGLFKGVSSRMPDIFYEQRKMVNAKHESTIAIYKKRIKVHLEELWRDHFSSPWKAIALLVAFAILCLTLIQTIYTVKK